jgi:anaerobic magnesium-protoporphyrin IX monomethyl ester cyclase
MNYKQKKILLIFPRIDTNVDVKILPFGLLAVASSLRKSGIQVKIIDLNIEPEEMLYNSVTKDNYLYIGFSVFTGPMIQNALSVSKKIHQLSPDLPIVWGGPHPTIMPELTIQHHHVDVVCCGEGEKTAVRLAKAVHEKISLETIHGITFKKNGNIISTAPVERIRKQEVDNSISLNLETINLDPYIFQNKGKKSAVFLTSRGCPYRCSFCWNLMFHKRRYLAWKPDKIKKEIEPLIKSGVKKILLYDSFLGSIPRIRKIGELFQSLGLEWAIEDGCRVDCHSSDEFFRCLAETGCSHVAFGAESGSQRILNFIDKDISIDDILRSAKARRPYKIAARYQWMTGIPGERKSDVKKTLDLVDRVSQINHRSAHNFEVYLPYPGNELFKKACAEGWTPPNDLEGWGMFRWEGRYPYHKEGTWFFKSVQYSNFFYRYSSIASMSSLSSKIRPIFRLASRMLWPFAAIRWKTRFFRFPLEFWLSELIRRIFEHKLAVNFSKKKAAK